MKVVKTHNERLSVYTDLHTSKILSNIGVVHIFYQYYSQIICHFSIILSLTSTFPEV